MIRQALSGLGIVAYGDPSPGPGVPSGLSYSPGQSPGRIRLVSSMGRQREATYMQVYESNPFVYAATNYVSRGIARLPLHLFVWDDAGEKTRVRGRKGGRRGPQQLDWVLNHPQGRLSRAAFWGGTVRQRLILGNALWTIERDRGGTPTGLKRLPWQQVSHVEEDGAGNALWYEVRDPRLLGMRANVIAPSDVIHFGFGSEADRACGTSLLESCHATLALHEALVRHLLGYLENGGRPSGHLRVERANRERVREIRDLMTELYASPENAGKILVSSGDWQKTGDSPEHSQIVELLKQSRLEIAAAFQTPPPVLGILENAIRANVKEMREQFGRDTIGPWASEFEDELESQLIMPLFAEAFCEFQLAEQLRPDLEARALVYQRMQMALTIDEIRQLENLPPLKIPGVTDVPWVPSGAMPVTRAAEEPDEPLSPSSDDEESSDDDDTMVRDTVVLNGNAHREAART